MLKEERLLKIINKLKLNESVSISKLANSFEVSKSTIRRDLDELEEDGYVKRTHGGAVLVEKFNNEYNFNKKREENFAEKNAIAKYAASLVEEGDIIAINSSTLTYLMIDHLTVEKLKIVTNSLDVLNQVSDTKNYDVSVLGGDYFHSARTIEGPITEKQIRKMHFDKSFLGVNGISLDLGLSTGSSIEASSKIAMIECSEEAYFLSESKKFDKDSFYKIADFEDVSMIITDQNLTDHRYNNYKDKVNLVRV